MKPGDLSQWLRNGLPALFECEELRPGTVRVWTPLLYPDGDLVDVFVVEQNGEFLLTDYGDTLGWLQGQSLSDELTANQRDIINDVCSVLNVKLDRGQLTVRLTEARALPEAIHYLAQAAVRVADIQFTFRPRRARTVADTVDRWLREQPQQFKVERRAKHEGDAHIWTVDYEVSLDTHRSLVFLLTPGEGSAWARTEHVFTGFSDLRRKVGRESEFRFVSLFDDTEGAWKDESIKLVQRVSKPVMWSKRDEFASLLATVPLTLGQ